MMPSCPPTSLGGQVMLCSAVQRERSGKRQRENEQAVNRAHRARAAGLVRRGGGRPTSLGTASVTASTRPRVAAADCRLIAVRCKQMG